MPRFGAGVLYTIIPTDRADHDGPLTVTWDTIRAANRAHSDLLARVRRLSCGRCGRDLARPVGTGGPADGDGRRGQRRERT